MNHKNLVLLELSEDFSQGASVQERVNFAQIHTKHFSKYTY